MADKTYRGVKWGDEVYVDRGSKRAKLSPRLDLLCASPTGFAWGIDQPGAAQLAFALLFDALDNDGQAMRFHMRYKRRVLLALDKDRGWTLTLADVLAEVEAIKEVDKLVQREQQRIAKEPPPVVSDRGQGVVWDAEPREDRE